MATTRTPLTELRPFVRRLWVAESRADQAGTSDLMLPAAKPHLVVRVGAEPVRISAGPSDSTTPIATAVVGGPRWEPYVRSNTGAGCTVGALLAPGASSVLFGIPGAELAGRHVALRDVAPGAEELEEALAACTGDRERLDLVEGFLLSSVRRYAGMHPAVSNAVERLARQAAVGEVVAESGYSHRRFNDRFRAAVGMSPKLYSRVSRFERALARLAKEPADTLALVAAAAGYSDQAHLCREFRQFAGMTITDYTHRAEHAGSRHVRLA